MNRIIVVFSLVFVSTLAVGQIAFDIGVSYNYYPGNSKYYERMGGHSTQLDFSYDLTQTLSISTGLEINGAEDNSYKYITYIDVDENSIVVRKSANNTNSVNFYLPVTLEKELIKNRLILLAGVSLNHDNVFIFNNEDASIDPETSSYNSDTPLKRHKGYGYHLGILYRAFSKLGIYSEWKSTRNDTFNFNYVEFGVKVRLYEKS